MASRFASHSHTRSDNDVAEIGNRTDNISRRGATWAFGRGQASGLADTPPPYASPLFANL
jgi:hypothetical protein